MIILYTKTAKCGIKAFGHRVLIIFYFHEVWWFGSVAGGAHDLGKIKQMTKRGARKF